jgi:hypothetical protein
MTTTFSSDQLGNVNVEWINLASYILGGTVSCIAIMSFVAVTSADCRKVIIPASYLSLIVTPSKSFIQPSLYVHHRG